MQATPSSWRRRKILGILWKMFPDADTAFKALAQETAGCLQRALETRGKAHLVLSGGRTPRLYLPFLTKAVETWKGVTVSLCDERWVDVTDSDSNEGMIRERLMGQASEAAFCALMGQGKDIHVDAADAARRYGDLPCPADVSLLGAAPDGHIASLFSGTVTGGSVERVIVTRTPDGSLRLSLSPTALLETRRVMIVASGTKKMKTLKAAEMPGDVNELPARIVMNQDQVPVEVVTWS